MNTAGKSRQWKYLSIADALRARIEAGGVGERLEGELALAKRYAVSPLTVRQALQVLEREGLLDRSQGRATRVKDPRASKPVAVVCDYDISEPRISYSLLRVFQSVRRKLIAAHIPHMPYLGFAQAKDEPLPMPSCTAFTNDLEQGRLRGAVVVGTPNNASWQAAFDRWNLPVVGQAAGFRHRVMHDPRDIVRTGVRHLVARGRRKIGLLGWRRPYSIMGDVAPHGAFVETFREELAAARVRFRPDWVQDQWHPLVPGAGWEEFRALWTGSDRPDGLLVTDDVLFQDVALAILEAGVRVPDDLFVVAHTNKGSGARYPFPVAEVEADPEETADALFTLLLAQLRDARGVPATLSLKYRLLPIPDAELEAHASRTRARVNAQVT
jgi:DNA-binding LacI/PurR family transcriptional regulator